MKKIILLYAKFGGGHLSAATAIKGYIDENFPGKYEVKLIDFFSYMSKILNKTVTSTYLESLKYFPGIYGKIYKDSNYGKLSKVVKRVFDILSFRMKSLLLEEKPDIVISCHPYSSHLCSNVKKKNKLKFSLATIITDFAIHEQRVYGHEYTDCIFVSHEKMKDDLIEKGVDTNKIYITGIPISNKYLGKFDKNEIKKSFGLSDDKKTVLFFGGGEYGLANKKVLHILKSFIDYGKGIQIVVVSGKNKKMKLKFEDLVKQTNSDSFVKVLAYTNQVPELMSISDLIVTKPGGLTTTESLASGLPMLLINPIPGQEVDNTNFLEEQNVGIYIDEGNCKQVIDNLFSNNDLLKKMGQKAKSISQANATEEICKAIGLSK